MILGVLDEGSVASRRVVVEVGRTTVAQPQEVAHRDLTLEDVVSTIEGVEGEGPEDHLTIGVTHVDVAVDIERFAL